MDRIHSSIVCAYLYNITKYGYPPPAQETPIYLEEMAALGFRSVELEGIREAHLMEMYKMRHQISRKKESLDLNVPVYCTVLPALSSSDAATRSKQLELFRYGCETAATLLSNYILDNGPLPPYQFATDIPVSRHYEHKLLSDAVIPKGFSWATFWDDLVSTFQQVCDIAAEYNLKYLVHPAVGVLGSTPEAFLHFAKEVDRPNLGFNFDTANLLSFKCNLSLALHQMIDHTPYLHISDSGGVKNEHLGIGDGIINWDEFFNELRTLEYNGLIGIDIGGAESNVSNLDHAYVLASERVQKEMMYE